MGCDPLFFIKTILQVDSAVFHKVIEWLYTGQIKLQISQCDDALRLCKQCRLDGLREEIEHSLRKTYEFGKKLTNRRMYTFLDYVLVVF